jgi:hypothetical protein
MSKWPRSRLTRRKEESERNKMSKREVNKEERRRVRNTNCLRLS